MENREEEEIAKRWNSQQEHLESGAIQHSRIDAIERVEELVEVQLPAKRRMIAAAPAAPELVVDLEREDEERKKMTGRKRKRRNER